MLRILLFVFGLIYLATTATAQGPIYTVYAPPFSFENIRFVRVSEDRASLIIFVPKIERVERSKEVSLPNGTVQIMWYHVDGPTGETAEIPISLERVTVFGRSGELVAKTELYDRLKKSRPAFCFIGATFEPHEAVTSLLSPQALVVRIDSTAEESFALQLKLGLLHGFVSE